METKKFKGLLISDNEPKVGDVMICIQKKNVCYGQLSEPVNHFQVKSGAIDTINWKVVENMEERKQQLVDTVIDDLKNSFEVGDYTVLDELLKLIPLRNLVQALPEEAWKPLRKVTDKGLIVGRKEWAEVEFVPTKPSKKKKMEPDRYLAIRIRPAQGELFEDGNAYHYFAVVTNIWSWNGERLLRWQRERCGTVEKVHDVLKNDLAAGVMPAKRFFTNAAWWRLNLLTYNILSIMKRKALPPSWWPVRLKALRFHLLCIAARVIEHGRRLFLKIAKYHPHFLLYKEAREKLFLFSSA